MIANLDRERFEPHVFCPPGRAAELFREAGATVHEGTVAAFTHIWASTYRGRRWLLLARELARLPLHVVELERVLRAQRFDLVHLNDSPMIPAAWLARRARIPVVWHLRSAPPAARTRPPLAARAEGAAATRRGADRHQRRHRGALGRARGRDPERGGARPLPSGRCGRGRERRWDCRRRVRSSRTSASSTRTRAFASSSSRRRRSRTSAASTRRSSSSAAASAAPRSSAARSAGRSSCSGSRTTTRRRRASSCASTGLDDRFRFVPFTPDIAELYRASAVVIAPSQGPEIGRPVLEGAASGVAVIATGTQTGGGIVEPGTDRDRRRERGRRRPRRGDGRAARRSGATCRDRRRRARARPADVRPRSEHAPRRSRLRKRWQRPLAALTKAKQRRLYTRSRVRDRRDRDLRGEPVSALERRLAHMNDLLAHRGPDGEGMWIHERGHVGLRAPPARDHRPRDRRPADDGRAPATGSPTTARSTTTSSCATSSGAASSARRPTPRSCCARTAAGDASALERLRGMFAFALWDEAERAPLLRARPLRHQAALLRRRRRRVLSARPRRRRCCRSCRRSRPTSTGSSDYLAFQFCLAGKTLFKGVHELLPGHRAHRPERRSCASSATGRSTTSPTSTTPSSTSSSGSARSSRTRSRAPPRGRAGRRVPQRRARLEHRRRRSPRARSATSFKAFTGKFAEAARYDESAYARALAELARLRAARDRRSAPSDFVDIDPRRRSTTSTIPVAGPGSFPQYMVSRLARAAHEGRARRPGRRRDLRRLRALPARVLRAVHQGRDRRDDARRQLRRHVRVDHPEPRDAARVQAADAGVLARRASSATSTSATSA